jgi:hypothetical protein
MPVHRDRSRPHEARLAGLAITLSTVALILVVVYVVGGLSHRVVVQLIEFETPSASAP